MQRSLSTGMTGGRGDHLVVPDSDPVPTGHGWSSPAAMGPLDVDVRPAKPHHGPRIGEPVSKVPTLDLCCVGRSGFQRMQRSADLNTLNILVLRRNSAPLILEIRINWTFETGSFGFAQSLPRT